MSPKVYLSLDEWSKKISTRNTIKFDDAKLWENSGGNSDDTRDTNQHIEMKLTKHTNLFFHRKTTNSHL